ncbi:GNAT family N-acetyltransferase [Thalassoroseus pseudoceratinae]|uniref:GNAT family N-acetyltransferase n=1 Tax=Thalassoroseus pseudoceratinae TaxID=2713176 RepID=UPI00141D8304|nr:GNAT family N-acetyltransferase [Thalassoroseus pseudoceratinae]
MITFPSLSGRVVELFESQITKDFDHRKAIQLREELLTVAISLGGQRGFLVPVSECHANDSAVVRLLTKFRKPITTFPSFFEVTEERTHRWLRTHLLDMPDRILFLIVNRTGQIIGHAGFARCHNPQRTMELDNVIRGVPDAEPGLMSMAVGHLIAWANTTFQPSDIVLHVMQDNPHAIRFYERLGFVVTASQPLKRVELPGEIRLEPFEVTGFESPDGYYLTMTHRPAASQTQPPHFPLI